MFKRYCTFTYYFFSYMKNSSWLWVLGAALLIVLILGWWWKAGSASPVASTNATPATAATTTAPSAPTASVALQVRTGNVVAVIDSIPDASRFAQMLGTSAIASQLTGKGPYTVFVPINEAYAHLPSGMLTDLSAAQLKRLMQYHVIAGKAIDVDAQSAGTVAALSGDMLNFSVRSGDQSARVNSSVALQSYKASNGIVYLVDQVLIPPTQ
jgi:uncharacterized surface protein with fasciclin (FAS1) repeats